MGGCGSLYDALREAKMFRDGDLQVLQPGQVREGPFLNNPQTVDIPQRTAERRRKPRVEVSCNYRSAVNKDTRALWSHPGGEGLRTQRCNPERRTLEGVIAFVMWPGRVGCWRSGRHSHLSQAVERQEGVPLDLRDAVALGDLAVAQTHGSRLTHESVHMGSEGRIFLNTQIKRRHNHTHGFSVSSVSSTLNPCPNHQTVL